MMIYIYIYIYTHTRLYVCITVMSQVNKSFFFHSKVWLEVINFFFFFFSSFKGKNKEPKFFLFFDRVSMKIVISLFLVSSRRNHWKWGLVEKNIRRKSLFYINYTVFLLIQTNNYVSLTSYNFTELINRDLLFNLKL